MITYVNSGNDAKRFNTFALAAKHSLIKKQQAINTQIDYLKSVYNRYVSHYNQLQKLIKEVNDLTGESRYTKEDYSDFPAVDISASFSMKLSNIRLVPEGTSSLRFKNTIEDLRNNFSDLSLSIKSFYSRAMTELSPYGSMNQKTDSIREKSSKASTVVGTNINTALTEGDLSTEDWSNIKEQANAAAAAVNTSETAEEREAREAKRKAEKKAREEAEKAFNKEQSELEEAANKAQDEAEKADKLVSKFGNGFYTVLNTEKTDKGSSTTYKDPITKETFSSSSIYSESESSYTESYTDAYDSSTSIKHETDSSFNGTYTVIKDGRVIGTYSDMDEAEAFDAANKAAGKDLFKPVREGDIIDTAEGIYEENKEKAKEKAAKAHDKADKAAKAAEEHRNSGSSSGSSGGT